MQSINQIIDQVINFMINYGVFIGVLLIILESIIPILPLSVFITLNVASYGGFIGIIISWLATIMGCTLSFFLFRKCFRNKLYKIIKNKDLDRISNIMKEISKISFSNLVLIIAMPFSPAFFINIAAGLSKIEYRKFVIALMIGKLIMVYFWGFIGTSLLESVTDITILIRIVFLLFIALILSKIVGNKLNIK